MWGQHLGYIIRSHDQKKSSGTSFQLSWPKRQSSTWFWFSWPKEWKSAIGDPFASCDTDANTHGITWQKCHVGPYFICLKLWNAIVSVMMLFASCDPDPSASDFKLTKILLDLISIILIWEMLWCHWQCYQPNMMPGLVPMMWHNQTYVAPDFYHHKIKNARMPLMVLSTCSHLLYMWSIQMKTWFTHFLVSQSSIKQFSKCNHSFLFKVN